MIDPHRRIEIKGWNGIYKQEVGENNLDGAECRFVFVEFVRNPEAPPQTSERRTNHELRTRNVMKTASGSLGIVRSIQDRPRGHGTHYATKLIIQGQSNPMNRKIRITD